MTRLEYSQALQVSIETEEYNRQHPEFADRAMKTQVAINKVHCALYLRRYDEGKLFAREELAIVKDGSLNWFIAMAAYFLLAMYSEDFPLALEIFGEVRLHRRFKTVLDMGRQETWRVFEGYLQFVVKCGWVRKDHLRTPTREPRSRMRSWHQRHPIVRTCRRVLR